MVGNDTSHWVGDADICRLGRRGLLKLGAGSLLISADAASSEHEPVLEIAGTASSGGYLAAQVSASPGDTIEITNVFSNDDTTRDRVSVSNYETPDEFVTDYTFRPGSSKVNWRTATSDTFTSHMWEAEGVDPGETLRPSLVVEIAEDVDPGEYYLVPPQRGWATWTGPQGETDTGFEFEVAVQIGGTVALDLELTGDTAPAGGEAEVTLQVTNRGDSAATGLEGALAPPSEAWTATQEGGLSALDPGETATVTFRFDVPTDAQGEYTFSSRIEDDAGITAEDTATVTVEPATADLTVDITKTVAGGFADAVFTAETDEGELPDDVSVYFAGPVSAPLAPGVEPGDELELTTPTYGDNSFEAEAVLLAEDSAADGEYPLRFELRASEATVAEATGPLEIDNAPLVVADLLESYETMHERALNDSWWRTEAGDAAEDALEGLNPGFEDLAVESLATTVGELAGSTTASVVTGLVTVIDQLTSLFVAFQRTSVATAMQAYSHDDVRQTLDDLIDNTDAFASDLDREERDERFRTRRSLLEELQSHLPEYLGSVRENARDAPGVDFDDYMTVRAIVEELRLLMYADYAATRRWLDDDPQNVAIAADAALWHEIHRRETRTRVVAAMDHGADYQVVEITIPEAFDGYRLLVDLGAPATLLDAGIRPTLSPSEPDPATPGRSGTTFERAGDGRLELRGEVSAGTYYLLVTAEGVVGPYELDIRVREDKWSFSEGVPVRIDDVGWPPEATTATVDNSASATTTDPVVEAYESAPDIEEGTRTVRAAPEDPARYATVVEAGQRLRASVDSEAADDVELYVDRLVDGTPQEVTSTDASGHRGEVVVDAEEMDNYYISVYTAGDNTAASVAPVGAPNPSGATDSDGVGPVANLAAVQSDSAIETELKVATEPATPRPRAVVQGPPEPLARAPVTLDGRESVAPSGSIESYEWDLDDDGEFEATGETVDHRFPDAGEVTVRLRVTDSEGATDIGSATFEIQPSEVTATPTGDDGELPGWVAIGSLATGAWLYRHLRGDELTSHK